MDVDLSHPHDGVLLSLENNHTHTDLHGRSGFRFHEATTANLFRVSLFIRPHDRRGCVIRLGEVFEFSNLPTLWCQC
jgi:hypothetical protein